MSFAPAPILETERLVLRAPAPEDFEAWATFAADEETMRHLGGVQASARSRGGASARSITARGRSRGFSMFSLIEKSSSNT